MNFQALSRFAGWTHRVENWVAIAAILLMGLLPALELGLRAVFSTGIPGNIGYVQHLTLWVGFMGAVVATNQGRHLGITVGVMALPERWRKWVAMGTSAIAIAVSAGLFLACTHFFLTEYEFPNYIGGWLPVWVAISVLPLSFALITIQLLANARSVAEWVGAACLLGVMGAAWAWYELPPSPLVWIPAGLLFLAALGGAPIYVVLGGLALVLFLGEGIPIAALPVETYRIAVSPSIPTIPLFALTGYILAEGEASERLVRLFRAWFGWLPGGLAVVTTLVCAFFSVFTGASGVTIVALAGLLMTVLVKNGYPERFSTGLLTATGSIGLLFPPSLAVILYGVVAHVPIPGLFRAGIVPGALMVLGVSIFGIVVGIRSKSPRTPFELREAVASLWVARFEVLLPVVALVGIFGGFATLVEAASITVVYTLLVELLIHRDLHWARDVPQMVLKCVTLVGGVFVILGVAMGLTNYLIDAEVPMRAAGWVQAGIESKWVFLGLLNVFLLLVGALMDIFSATVVVVPLILPIAKSFGIDPYHLAMIFLINLELGYLTPPVGLNLFLASYRFEKPVLTVARSALPFFFILLVVLLLVTYIPFLTTGVFPP